MLVKKCEFAGHSPYNFRCGTFKRIWGMGGGRFYGEYKKVKLILPIV